MVDLKISHSDLRQLLPQEDPGLLEDVFSYISWSVICEPGDGFAGMVINALGAKAALANELQDIDVTKIRSSLLAAGLGIEDIEKHGNFEKAYLTARERWRPRVSLGLVRAAIFKMQKLNGFTLTPVHESWPKQLNDLDLHSPIALWVRGKKESLDQLQNSVAVVGCRGSSAYGEFATHSMVSALVEKNISVVSGGAYGIDGVAHRSALAMQGNTVAVMAGGVDKFYPSGHTDLLRRISESGAVMSELPPGTIPSKWRFLQRNRLIAALSKATLVVEANWRSGSLNTVSHAERLEREVFAVPGPVTSPKSAGTNKLIAERRAELVIDGRDLLERLGVERRGLTKQELAGMGAIETRVLDALGFNALELSEICAEAGLTRDEAKFGLSILELDGIVTRRDTIWTRSQTTV